MEMVVFSGIQGAGKTTFFHQHFSATHVRISLDLLRTRNREDILLFACLAAQQQMVVDNTNPTAEQRARYAMLARAAQFRTRLYFFDSSLEESLVRNLQRPAEYQVPEIGVRGTYAKLQRPQTSEPFDEIVRIALAADGSWQIGTLNDEI
jgi:predicted kinase